MTNSSMITGVCQVRLVFLETQETLELPVTPEAQVMQAVQVTRVPAQVPARVVMLVL